MSTDSIKTTKSSPRSIKSVHLFQCCAINWRQYLILSIPNRRQEVVNQLFFSEVFHKLITGNQMAAIFNFIYIKLLLSSCTKLYSIANIIMEHFDMSYLLIALFVPKLWGIWLNVKIYK